MNTHKLQYLSYCFKPNFFEKLLSNNHYNHLKETAHQLDIDLNKNKEMKIHEILDHFYELLVKYYRCEYVYKNEVTNKIFLSKHSLKRSTLVSEFRCAHSRTDIAIFNGTSNAYEIKTELDSLSKLEKQLSDYSKIFDKIYIITSDKLIKDIKKNVPEHVGILRLNEDLSITTVKKAHSNKSNTNIDWIFNCLQQKEYINAYKTIEGIKPEVPNSRLYKTCREAFRKLDTIEAHDIFVNQIRKRQASPHKIDFIYELPNSLKQLSFDIKLRKKDINILKNMLFERIYN